VRPESARRVPAGATAVAGDALSRETFTQAIARDTVVVHLVGTPRPSPAKAAEFEAVDFVSARECIEAARVAGAAHFVYVSVAHPAPVMQAYVNVRIRGEALLRESGTPHTILRPWYVLGPGHRWAYALLPMYWLLAFFPSTRDGARRLGLVTLGQMIGALEWAVETADSTSRILGVPEIRERGRWLQTTKATV
jgi:uncharacterized protein YbjT (DUF2867 family)